MGSLLDARRDEGSSGSRETLGWVGLTEGVGPLSGAFLALLLLSSFPGNGEWKAKQVSASHCHSVIL